MALMYSGKECWLSMIKWKIIEVGYIALLHVPEHRSCGTLAQSGCVAPHGGCASNTPPQPKQHRPIAFENCLCFSWTSPLVRTSVVCSSVRVYSKWISSPSTLCLKKWCRTLMCLVRSWNSGLCVMAIVDWLSTWRTVGELISRPSLLSSRL